MSSTKQNAIQLNELDSNLVYDKTL